MRNLSLRCAFAASMILDASSVAAQSEFRLLAPVPADVGTCSSKPMSDNLMVPIAQDLFAGMRTTTLTLEKERHARSVMLMGDSTGATGFFVDIAEPVERNDPLGFYLFAMRSWDGKHWLRQVFEPGGTLPEMTPMSQEEESAIDSVAATIIKRCWSSDGGRR